MASMASELGEPLAEGQMSRGYQASMLSQWEGMNADADAKMSNAQTYCSKRSSRAFELPVESISEEHAQTLSLQDAGDRPRLNRSAPRSISEFPVPEGYLLVPIKDATKPTPSTCTCGCHKSPLQQKSKPTYADVSIQTDNVPSPPRTALRVDTKAASTWSPNGFSAVSHTDMSPIYDDYPAENPIFLGRTTSYFSKPGYQLGDSLMSQYQTYEPVVYYYQDEFGEEVLR